jgi:VanZ family protein
VKTPPYALWVPVVFYLALIFWLSSISYPPELPSGVTDKAAHAALYLGLGALLVRALAGGFARPVTVRVMVLAVVVSGLYGVTDEIHQYFVPPRQMDAADVLADTIGATVAACALYTWGIIRGRHAL